MCNNQDECLPTRETFSVTDCSVSADAKAHSFVTSTSSTDLVISEEEHYDEIYSLDPVLGFDECSPSLLVTSQIVQTRFIMEFKYRRVIFLLLLYLQVFSSARLEG